MSTTFLKPKHISKHNKSVFDITLILKFRCAEMTIRQNIDGAEQFQVKDLRKVLNTWRLPEQRLEPVDVYCVLSHRLIKLPKTFITTYPENSEWT